MPMSRRGQTRFLHFGKETVAREVEHFVVTSPLPSAEFCLPIASVSPWTLPTSLFGARASSHALGSVLKWSDAEKISFKWSDTETCVPVYSTEISPLLTMKGFNILFLSIPSIVHASVVQNRGALLNRASIGTVVDCGDGIGIGVGPCPSSSVTSNPSTITPTAALSTTRTGSVVSSHAAITSASSGSVVSSHAAITSASSGSETIGRCGPTSVSTIPGCWGTPGCAYYL
ncbi:hypothetical protein BDR22DRAFT_826651 [Usnea florida]